MGKLCQGGFLDLDNMKKAKPAVSHIPSLACVTHCLLAEFLS